jgi:hypothetical protein
MDHQRLRSFRRNSLLAIARGLITTAALALTLFVLSITRAEDIDVFSRPFVMFLIALGVGFVLASALTLIGLLVTILRTRRSGDRIRIGFSQSLRFGLREVLRAVPDGFLHGRTAIKYSSKPSHGDAGNVERRGTHGRVDPQWFDSDQDLVQRYEKVELPEFTSK